MSKLGISVALSAQMNLNLLQLFVEVADSKGFSAAARKLRMQRSSVSRGVAALEVELGVQLFTRSTRHVSLTSAGTSFYAQIAPQLASLSNAVAELPEREGEASGQLRISASHDFAVIELPRIVAGFTQRYPKVHIDARITNRVVDLVAEGFDAVLRPGPGRLPDSSLIARKLGDATANVYASPAYLARAGTPKTLDETTGHDWVVGPGGTHRGIPTPVRQPVVTGNDLLFVYECVKEGLGLALLPNYMVRDDVITGTLVRVLPLMEQLLFSFFLIHPPLEHYPRKLSVFRDYLVEYFRSQPLL